MLNNADSYQGGSAAGEKVGDAEALFVKLKTQVKAHCNQVNCRKEAPEDFDFERLLLKAPEQQRSSPGQPSTTTTQ